MMFQKVLEQLKKYFNTIITIAFYNRDKSIFYINKSYGFQSRQRSTERGNNQHVRAKKMKRNKRILKFSRIKMTKEILNVRLVNLSIGQQKFFISDNKDEES